MLDGTLDVFIIRMFMMYGLPISVSDLLLTMKALVVISIRKLYRAQLVYLSF
jgi:hypothetical protein